MNLLLTNVREDTAYLLIRSLHRDARRIVLAVSGDTWSSRWTGMARYSRHVNASHRVPDPAADWWAGRIQATNTEAEEAYVQRLEEICDAERITVIFPSFDPEVYVLAKNRQRFASAGVTVVTPPLESVLAVQDKATVLKAAARSGFPHPLTYYPESVADLADVVAAIDPPWVLKPRFSAHGTDIQIAFSRQDLEARFARMAARQACPLVQAYVTGGLKQNFYLVVDNQSNIASVFAPRVTRVRRYGVRTGTAACISSRDAELLPEVQSLIASLGLCGGFTLQTQIDARDGVPRLMEINPRLGHNLWFRTETGIPEPAMLIRIARGEHPGAVSEIKEGVLLLDPLIDAMHLLRQCRHRLASLLPGGRQSTPALPEDSVRDLLGDFRRDYFGARSIITSPLNRGYLNDPGPPLSRLARQVIALLKPNPGPLR